MMKFTLTMLDTTGIQSYVFGSNRLQENIGASELVYRATTIWAFKALEDEGLRHNIKDWFSLDWYFDLGNGIEENDSLMSEVVYAGGGNTMLIFRHEEDAKRFTRQLTRQVLKDAPGLTLVARHASFNWNENGAIRDKRIELLNTLAAHKQARLPSTPYLGMGVTAACQSTGLAAVQTNTKLKLAPAEDTLLISRETAAKLQYRDKAKERLENQLGMPVHGDYPSDVDKLGRIMGEESYVAIVHADGNQMGRHFDNAGENATNNRAFTNAIRNFSQDVKHASLNALRSVVQQLDKSIEWNDERKQLLVSDTVPIEANRWFPLRPLVFGGDDVTFLCNGQLGVSLAAAYLDAFERETQELGLKNMYACAGVGIVKMHYPFARAYTLSEELAGSAKKYVRKEYSEDDCSALDWHFGVSGLSGSLGSIRRREYIVWWKFKTEEEKRQDKVSQKNLCMRPIRLYAADGDQSGRYWEDGLEQVIREFNSAVPWVESRNKVIGLREPLRSGPKATEQYRKNYALASLPAILPGNEAHRIVGWNGDRCVYFDAIELLDHYVPVEVKP